MSSCQHIILRGKRCGEPCGYPAIAGFSLCEGCLNKVKKYNYVHKTCLHLEIKDVGINITLVLDVYNITDDISTVLEEENANLVIFSKEKVYDLLGILNPDGSLRNLSFEEEKLARTLLI